MLKSDEVISFTASFERLAVRHAASVACVNSDGQELTYAELDAYVDRCLAFLHDKGLGEGDTIVALMPNAVVTVVLFLACLKGGLRYAPLSCVATPTEVASLVRLSSARAVYLSDAVSDQSRVPIAALGVLVEEVASSATLEWLPERRESTPKPGGGQLLIATSGSTGEPKAMVIDGDRLWSAGIAFTRFHAIENSKPRFWNYLPMSYLGGLFNLALIPLCAGGSFVVDEPFSGKTFLGFWQTVERLQIDALWMVPSIVRGLVTLAERTKLPVRHETIRHCFLGTAPINLAEKERFRQLFDIEMLENFGLSETTFITSEIRGELVHRSQGSVGGVLPYVELKLVPPLVAPELGTQESDAMEIAIRSPFLMLGYLRGDGTVEDPRDADGYFRTGDLGRMVRGQLVIAGRSKDIIKKGGHLIVLREVEQLAEMNPEVAEAAAAAIPHPFYGETYVLCVRFATTRDALAVARFTAWLQENLVRHKWPDRVIARDEFPRTASGKIQKSVLRQEVMA